MTQKKGTSRFPFPKANQQQGATLIPGRIYEIKNRAGVFFGKLVNKISRTTVLLIQGNGKKQKATIDKGTVIHRKDSNRH